MKIQAREALIAANQLLLFSHYNEGSFLLSIKLRKKRGPGVTTLFSISSIYASHIQAIFAFIILGCIAVPAPWRGINGAKTIFTTRIQN